MITKLTKKQEDQIPIFIEKYIALASKPTNRKKATEAVQNLYKSVEQKKPIVIFSSSPLMSVIMVAVCKILFKNKLPKDDSQLRSQLSSQLGSQLDSQLGSQLDSQLSSQLHSQLFSQLRSQLRDQLNTQLDSQLRSQLRDQLNTQLDSQLRSQLSSQLDSQLREINNHWWLIIWWLVWAGWYDFGHYIGVKFDNNIFKLFMDFVTNVSFIIPYEGIAFVSETPTTISWKNKKLHNDKDMAVKYTDGYRIYIYEGIRVNEKIIKTPEKLTKKDWMDEKNLEVRRIIQERMRDRFAVEIGGKVVGKHEDRRIGEVIEVDISPDPEKIAHYLHVTDWSTERMYFIMIPPTISDPMEAQAWSYSEETITITKKDMENLYERIKLKQAFRT